MREYPSTGIQKNWSTQFIRNFKENKSFSRVGVDFRILAVVLVITALFLSSILSFAAPTAFAASSLPIAVLTPPRGVPGKIVSLAANNFNRSFSVSILFDKTKLETIPKGTLNMTGGFVTSITIPSSASIGFHNVTLDGGNGGTVTRHFNVVLASSAPHTSIVPTKGPVGREVTVKGKGFTDSSTITVKFGSVQVASGPTNSTGGFTIAFPVPNESVSSKPYIVTTTDAKGLSATSNFTIT
jgi:hypothetical protein